MTSTDYFVRMSSITVLSLRACDSLEDILFSENKVNVFIFEKMLENLFYPIKTIYFCMFVDFSKRRERMRAKPTQ